MRISEEITEFGSDLICSFLAQLCPLIKGALVFKKHKTVQCDTLMHIIEQFSIIQNIDVTFVKSNIRQKLREYSSYLVKSKTPETAEQLETPEPEVEPEVEVEVEPEVETEPAKKAAPVAKGARRVRTRA